MKKTAWELTLDVTLRDVFPLVPALLFFFVVLVPLPLLPPVVALAWAQDGNRAPTETPPVAQEAATQQTLTQGAGGSLISAPSATPSEQPLSPDVSTHPTQTSGPGGSIVSTPSLTGGQAVPAQGPSTGPGGEAETTFVDVMHGDISQRILSTATWLDSFFGDRRYTSDLNPSYIRFRYNVFLEKGAAPVLKPDFEVRLILPQLREKMHLVISGVPKETNEFSAVQTNSSANESATSPDRNVTTALHYAPIETVSQSFIIRGGLKFSTKGIDVTSGPYYRVLFPFQSGWKLRFIEDLTYKSHEKWKSSSTIDLERPLPRDLFFRTSTEWVHTEHVDGFIYALSFALSQPLGSKRAITYSWVNVCETSPVNELTEIDLRVSYRKRVWRDWLYFEVMPQYRFPRTEGFEATPGILFRIDMLFGNLAT